MNDARLRRAAINIPSNAEKPSALHRIALTVTRCVYSGRDRRT